jgi:hypothetical protein
VIGLVVIRKHQLFHLVTPVAWHALLIPGKRETLRVSGKAEVVRDRALLEAMSAEDEENRLY